MKRWFSRRYLGNPDPDAFQRRLATAFGIDPRRYPPERLHKDFAAAFLREQAGRRALYKILEWGHLYQPVFVAGDPHGTAFRDGERNLALRILAALNAEPEETPDERD